MKLDILAMGPHPDDVELGCGGTLAKAVAEGKKVGIIDLTNGELGTRGSREIRLKEAEAAKNILGVHARENLNMRDGFFLNDETNQLEVIKAIRKYRPEILITGAPEDRHPDHGRATELIVRASFLAGLPRIETGQEAWRPKRIFHYIQWKPLTPDFVVDISGYLETKIDSCLAYASQFHDPNSDEPETAISSTNFKESINYRAKDWGRLIWKDAGEAFISESILGVDSMEVFL
ncbi:bacillithiol biosynthesis deacetylase BshB1 [Weeksellaceae bacterium KMM 9713]|uniref:Bacillithiol biosynthesis deacetylase BshB1 n=1 Tax=Profundicola chukchiensis TaxID=2961959 RepID=A0A9X4N0N5_9FLAO|nr:bacillithiol biosynthesis deacetylase BshB1 [Profundicola chukchiensis]MDG4946196.1 bacillithiol biosynthesis deacetylase BshB1 [Profundicola chukchiensis]